MISLTFIKKLCQRNTSAERTEKVLEATQRAIIQSTTCFQLFFAHDTRHRKHNYILLSHQLQLEIARAPHSQLSQNVNNEHAQVL